MLEEETLLKSRSR